MPGCPRSSRVLSFLKYLSLRTVGGAGCANAAPGVRKGLLRELPKLRLACLVEVASGKIQASCTTQASYNPHHLGPAAPSPTSRWCSTTNSTTCARCGPGNGSASWPMPPWVLTKEAVRRCTTEGWLFPFDPTPLLLFYVS